MLQNGFRDTGIPIVNMNKQAGFLPLMGIIVAGIMAGAAVVSVDAYKGYTQRAIISTGIQLADDIKKAATVYVASTGRFPVSNAEATLPDALELGDGHVLSVEIGKEPTKGTITVTFKGDGAIADGDKLLLIPWSAGESK